MAHRDDLMNGDSGLARALLDALAQESDHEITNISHVIANDALSSLTSSDSAHDTLEHSVLPSYVHPSEAEKSEIRCRSCGALCPSSHRYCGFCAAYLGNRASKHHFAPIEPTPVRVRIEIISINEDNTDGVRIQLTDNETILGRSGNASFPSDAFLSPKHARLIIENDRLFIEDLDSLNGTFLRTRSEVLLQPGDCFFAGRQLLRFERFEQVLSHKARSDDGTRYMGSPSVGGDYKLVQIGVGGVTQNVYCLSENGAVFGREIGDIVFNRDRFMSSKHAQIYPHEDGNYYLLDLNSSNGTWMKLNKKTRLYHGDFLFLGQQLFRIESPDIA